MIIISGIRRKIGNCLDGWIVWSKLVIVNWFPYIAIRSKRCKVDTSDFTATQIAKSTKKMLLWFFFSPPWNLLTVICIMQKKCTFKRQRYTFSENGSKMPLMIPFSDFKRKILIFLVKYKMKKEIPLKMAIFGHFWPFLAIFGP